MQSGWVTSAAVTVLALAGGPMQSQSVIGQMPMTQAQQAPWQAIGQITYGAPTGGAICTATLVAADLVLTAGHCVSVNGVPMLASSIQFAAGWRAGSSSAVRHGVKIILAAPPPGKAPGMMQDVALMVLDAPIDAKLIRPLSLAPQDQLAEHYRFIGYRRDAPEIVQHHDTCALAAAQPGVLVLTCPVVSGNSGAPVLVQRQGEWQVAAVMVAQSNGGDVRSFAVIPDDNLRARIALP